MYKFASLISLETQESVFSQAVSVEATLNAAQLDLIGIDVGDYVELCYQKEMLTIELMRRRELYGRTNTPTALPGTG